MEPLGGQPPDRDRQVVLRSQTPTIQTSTSVAPTQQQQLVPFQQSSKPDQLTLNLSAQQQIQKQSAVSPAITIFPVPSAKVSSAAGTSPALASTATAFSATTQAATAFSGSSIGHGHLLQHHHRGSQQHAVSPLPQHNPVGAIALLGGLTGGISGSSSSTQPPVQSQQPIEKLSRPMAFDKMESLVREMQDPEHGVPVRQQKMFLTSIPYAFMGYDLIEWLMDRLLIEESEALNIANQLCLHGYFFPVNDTKTLAVKDDSSLYRFQTPYYWPWQHKAPDNVEYAIYLAKRSLRNKQRHALEDYEAEALASLHKNLKGKWDFISMQAEEQVRLAKERKKGDKIVGDSQERAYWRVHRPPPGQFTPLEPCPVPSRDRQGAKPNKKKSIEDVQRELDYLKKSLNRTRMKMSQACESLVNYSETFMEYDFFLQPVLPSNPWVTEDVTFWQLNNTFVDVPTEKRVKRWAISIEELVCDPTGLQEFTAFLEKEYSHENIRFWIAVNRLRRSAHSQVAKKVNEIYEEFLKPGAPCEINIDGKTMESVLRGLKHPSRFTFDAASEHIYMLLLKKDCYPRFIRSEHYKRLLECGIQPSHKKRFFNFGGVSGAKKKMTAALSSQPNLGDGIKQGSGGSAAMMQAPPPGSLARRRGSDRSLTGSAHELAVIGVNKDVNTKVPHSHSQSNLSEIPYSCETIYRGDMPPRHKSLVMDAGVYAAYGVTEYKQDKQESLKKPEPPKLKGGRLETTIETSNLSTVCPWDEPPTTQAPVPTTQVQLSVCPWEQDTETDLATQVKAGTTRLTSTSSDNSEVSERIQRNLGIRHQNTVDSGDTGKRLMPNFTEQRRASMSFTPSRITEYQFGRSAKPTTTPSPTICSQSAISSGQFSLFATGAVAVATINSSKSSISKDPPSTASETDVEEELKQLTLAERKSDTSPSELPVQATPVPTPTPPPLTKITPPPEDLVARENTPTPIVESDFGSASDESVGPAEAVVSSGAGSDADDIGGNIVQEVQIELIEALDASQSSLILKQTSTPTIHVEDESGTDTKTAAEKKLKLISLTKQKTPINSVPSSPDKQLEVIISSDLATSDSTIELNPLPSPPVVSTKAETSPQHTTKLEEDVEMMKDNESYFGQEELSPTTDEYQEGLRFVSDTKDAYSYDIVDTDESTGGYIPPAPTPAPSIAPLAEMDIDTVDDEFCDIEESKSSIQQTPVAESEAKQAQSQALPAPSAVTATVGSEEVKKKRKKRNSDPKRMASLEEKEKATTSTNAKTTEADHNAVCPWEDESVTPSDGTFVKTYATLGYL